ncbi:sigma factor [Persephonella sp. KM09-Lau-8]|uniref:sigma-70 family RNA polymerase sigma factor n=1 Tax=Persephonella sp. KM09-Lau-8 TaxID=1158345 RepID=UPI000494F85F|nr:sigma factor [Persephonella sp. KM09-Lau-8]
MKPTEKQYVEKNIDFVWSETLKLIRKNPSLKEIQNDLISAGIEGLVVASKRFKPEKGFSFLTYAGHWVKQKMMEVNNSCYKL